MQWDGLSAVSNHCSFSLVTITLTAASWAAEHSCPETSRARRAPLYRTQSPERQLSPETSRAGHGDPLHRRHVLVSTYTCRVVVYTGTNTLPLDSPVEVEAIITVKPA